MIFGDDDDDVFMYATALARKLIYVLCWRGDLLLMGRPSTFPQHYALWRCDDAMTIIK